MAGVSSDNQTPYLHLNLGNDAVKNRNWAILDRRLYDLARGLISDIPAGGDLTGFYPDPIIKDGAMTPAKIAPGGDPGETLRIDAAGNLVWVSSTAATTISPIAPSNPLPGQLWWRDDPDGTLFIYYADVDSAQWVPATPVVAGPPGPTGPPGATGPQGPPGATGSLPAGPAGGSLAGTYPNPTLAPLAVTNAAVNDVAWSKITGAPASFAPSGAATGDLSGSYPNPKVSQATTGAFTVIGSMFVTGTSTLAAATLSGTLTAGLVTLSSAGAQINVTGTTAVSDDAIAWGRGTVRGRVNAGLSIASAELTANATRGGVQDDATKSSWHAVLDASATDNFRVTRQPAGSTTATTLLTLDATGQLTLPGDATGATVLLGNATSKARLQGFTSANPGSVGIFANRNWVAGNAQDDATRPSWGLQFNTGTDNMLVQRSPAGSTTQTNLLGLDATGRLTLAGPDTQVTFGSSTIKGQMSASTNGETYVYSNNYTAPMDATKSSWAIYLSGFGDNFQLYRRAPNAGAGVITAPLIIDGSSNMTLAGATAVKAAGTTWANPSDRRLKDNIEDYPTGLSAILRLHPRTFLYNGKGGSTAGMRGYGFIADEVESVMPETVSTRAGKLDADDDDTDIQTLDQSNLILALVNATKELANRVAALEAR